jgi:hypothetical protein
MNFSSISSWRILRIVALLMSVAFLLVAVLLFLQNPARQDQAHSAPSNAEKKGLHELSSLSNSDARRAALKEALISESIEAPASVLQNNVDRTKAPAHWRIGETIAEAPIVPSGFKLSPAFAQTTIQGKDIDLASRNGKFESLALQPEQEITVTVAWPTEHKIQQVAVQGVHGGTVNGEIGQVLKVGKNGTFTFRFKPSRGAGHDEVVCSAANVTFTLPIWVNSNLTSSPATINSIQ